MKKTTRFISLTILHSFFVRASVCRPFLALEQGKSQPPASRPSWLHVLLRNGPPAFFVLITVAHHPFQHTHNPTATDTGIHRTAWRDPRHYPQREGARRAAWNMQP